MKGCTLKYQAGMGLPCQSVKIGDGDKVLQVLRNADNNCIKLEALAQMGLGKEVSTWIAKTWI